MGSAILAEYGVRPEHFSPRIWEKSQLNGQVFSLALDSHPFILLYNTDIAGKAGVLDSNGQLTATASPNEFLAVARELQKVTGRHGLSYGYLGDGAQMWRQTAWCRHGT